MTIRGKTLAAGAVAAGVALAVGGTAQAAPQDGPAPIGYTVTATNAVTDSITGITAAFGTTATSVVGSTAVQVPAGTPIQFGATDSQGAAISWTATLPTGFDGTLAGVLTLPTAAVTAPASFTVKVSDGTAAAFATVSVTVGTTTGDDGVSVTPDTVALNAPWNHHGEVTFVTVPAGVAETLSNGPAGAAFSGGVLSVGSAVPGDYKGVVVTATDAAGATATETFEATIRPVYPPPPPPAPKVPRLSQGHAVPINSVREWVYYWQSGAASWDHFTIVGPGGINGHQGWVNGQLGLNAAWYSGLLAHHGYTVYYQPVEGRGSYTPVPGSHWGYVYFVS